MQRREVIRLLLGTAAFSLLPRNVLGLLQQVHEQLPAAPALKTLDPRQDAIVTAIAEWIIPQTDTPGAKATRVNEFIDLILTEWYDVEDRKRFLDGIDGVDKQSHQLFGKDFVDCSPAEQKQFLTFLDEELTRMRQAEVHAARRRRFQKHIPASQSFFHAMKQLTLVGYFTSEEGAKEALHYEVIPSARAGCAAIDEVEGEAAQ